jgi:hypothetical protein
MPLTDSLTPSPTKQFEALVGLARLDALAVHLLVGL